MTARAACSSHCPIPPPRHRPPQPGRESPNLYFLQPRQWVQTMSPGVSGDPGGRGSVGSKATGLSVVPCKLETSLLGAKNPLPQSHLPFVNAFPHKTEHDNPPAGRVLLAGAPTVAVALLLVGPVRGVPLEQVGVVGQHHLDSLQCLGNGSLLQGTPLLQGQAGRGSAQLPGGPHPAPPC